MDKLLQLVEIVFANQMNFIYENVNINRSFRLSCSVMEWQFFFLLYFLLISILNLKKENKSSHESHIDKKCIQWLWCPRVCVLVQRICKIFDSFRLLMSAGDQKTKKNMQLFSHQNKMGKTVSFWIDRKKRERRWITFECFGKI